MEYVFAVVFVVFLLYVHYRAHRGIMETKEQREIREGIKKARAEDKVRVAQLKRERSLENRKFLADKKVNCAQNKLRWELYQILVDAWELAGEPAEIVFIPDWSVGDEAMISVCRLDAKLCVRQENLVTFLVTQSLSLKVEWDGQEMHDAKCYNEEEIAPEVKRWAHNLLLR